MYQSKVPNLIPLDFPGYLILQMNQKYFYPSLRAESVIESGLNRLDMIKLQFFKNWIPFDQLLHFQDFFLISFKFLQI